MLRAYQDVHESAGHGNLHQNRLANSSCVNTEQNGRASCIGIRITHFIAMCIIMLMCISFQDNYCHYQSTFYDCVGELMDSHNCDIESALAHMHV